jgi:DNA-binding response OmpR family regulator
MERILIVDDDIYMCKSLSYVLKDEGYGVDTAYDSNSALNMFKRKQFDLVLMDYKLSGIPDMTGLWLLEKVKEINPAIKAIMISAYGDQNVKEKAKKIGADYFLDKPFLLTGLLKKVKASLVKEKVH